MKLKGKKRGNENKKVELKKEKEKLEHARSYSIDRQ
jgi:hypothetical protein